MASARSDGPSRFLARLTAFVAMLLAAMALAGWMFDLDQLTHFVPGWPHMATLTSLALLAWGLGLWLAAAGDRLAPAIVGAVVSVIGAVMLVVQIAGWNVHLEQLSLGPLPVGNGPVPRMAPATAFAFLVAGLSLLAAVPARTALLHQGLAIAGLLTGWVGLSRYVFGGEPLPAFAQMSVHTSGCILLLSGGLLALRTDAGIAALLRSDGVGGAMARRLLPAAIIVPLVAGMFATYYERRALFSFEAATSVFALLCMIAFVAFVWTNAARGERADRLRRAAERALRRSEEMHQLTFEAALDAIVMIDSRGYVTGWNTQAERMFGWPRTEALGRELAELIIPERQREQHREGLRRYVTTGVARVINRRIEMQALHRGGQEFPVELAITPIGFGEDMVYSAFLRDITARTRAEAALRESELRFRTTANAAPVLIWMSGPDKRCTWFNQRWLDFVGRSIEQELGDGWCDNLHPADFDRTLDTYHAAFDARRPYEMEYRLQRDDGAWRWLLERGTPNFGPDGEFAGFIGTCIDITEHRETVEALRESRARFKTLTESLPQMIWTCTRDGYCDYLSRQWLDYTGRTEAQQLGKGWLEQVFPEDRTKVEGEWTRVLTHGDTFDLSFRIRRFDGVYRWFKTRAVPLRDPAGRILKWFGSNTDIEDFVRASARVNVQLERMQLLDRTTHAIGVHQEPRKVFEVVLRSLEENLGVELGCILRYESSARSLAVAAVGERSLPLARELGLAERASVDVDTHTLGRCVRGELVCEDDIGGATEPLPARLAAGGLRTLIAAPLMIEEEVFGVMLLAKREAGAFGADDCEFLRQLSSHVALAAHQARLYDALQVAYQDLRDTQQTVMQQERLRALGQIASGIAHDINNALSPAALYTQALLERETSLAPRSREHLAVVQRAIDDVAQTVQRMRAFYMPRGQELTLAPVNVNEILTQVVDLTRARWNNMPQERGVVVRVDTVLAADLPRVLGAESEVRDALTNLMLNAVDALPDGGLISLRTRHEAAANHVIVEVEDNGIGMDETTRSRCLEPFFTTKGERGGTGLGLPMVFGMLQRHGGEIQIESELGRGTTVRLVFPAAPSGLTLAQTALAAHLPPLRILLIDDDPLILQSLGEALRIESHDVAVAEGGQAGIDAFAAALEAGRAFDAVITDLGMPYVDGRKVAARVRQLAPGVPIVMLTGWGHRLQATGDWPEHVDRVISKPPRMAELRAVLAELTQAERK